jgi:hypothetical protein
MVQGPEVLTLPPVAGAQLITAMESVCEEEQPALSVRVSETA